MNNKEIENLIKELSNFTASSLSDIEFRSKVKNAIKNLRRASTLLFDAATDLEDAEALMEIKKKPEPKAIEKPVLTSMDMVSREDDSMPDGVCRWVNNVRVVAEKNGERYGYSSYRECAREIGIGKTTVCRYVNSGKRFRGWMFTTY